MYSDIATFIENYAPCNGDNKESRKLNSIRSVTKCYIELKTNVQIDFTVHIGFGNLTGCTGKVISSSYGNKYPDIARGIDSMSINLNLILQSIINGNTYSNIMYRFQCQKFKDWIYRQN